MNEKTIGELVELAKLDNQEAFTELYKRTVNKAHFVARQILKDKEQADDIVQDSYIKALTNLHNLTDADKFQGWLDTIVINKCKDYLKKKKPRLFTELEYNEIPLDFEDTTIEFSPEASFDYEETKRLIGEMIERLPEDQKMCLLMFHYEEKSLNEIAEIMECSVNTVKSRLNYARKNLKQQVIELEAQGTKLHCFPLVPFLYWYFHQSMLDYAQGMAVGIISTGAGGSSVISSAAASSSTAASATAGLAGKAMAYGWKKIIMVLAICSGVTIGGFEIYKAVVYTPEHTIEKFEQAYNNWNLDSMIDCFEPDIQIQYNALKGLGGMLGFEPADLFSTAMGLSLWKDSDYDITKITINILDISYTSETQASVDIEIINNAGSSMNGTITLEKIKGQWYISE